MAKREPVAACATRVATTFLSPTVTRQINGGVREQNLKLHLEHAGLAPQHALDFQLRRILQWFRGSSEKQIRKRHTLSTPG